MPPAFTENGFDVPCIVLQRSVTATCTAELSACARGRSARCTTSGGSPGTSEADTCPWTLGMPWSERTRVEHATPGNLAVSSCDQDSANTSNSHLDYILVDRNRLLLARGSSTPRKKHATSYHADPSVVPKCARTPAVNLDAYRGPLSSGPHRPISSDRL